MPRKLAGLFEIVSLIIHVFIKVRIATIASLQNQEITGNVFSKSFTLSMLEKQTISDFFTIFCGVSVFVAYVLLYLKLDAMSPEEHNQYPSYLQMYV